MAERDGSSLNTFVVAAIAEKVGGEVAKKNAEKLAINIQTVQLASNLTINTHSSGTVATTDMPVDQSGIYQLPTNPCRDQ
jgi:hypothetical protein